MHWLDLKEKHYVVIMCSALCVLHIRKDHVSCVKYVNLIVPTLYEEIYMAYTNSPELFATSQTSVFAN